MNTSSSESKQKQNDLELLTTLDNSFIDFSLLIFPEYIKFSVPAFHQEMYKLLATEDRLVIAAPRGFAKSTLSSVFYPTWLALFGKRRDICIVSASENLAVELLRKIKTELESNEEILRLFGDVRSPKWTENHIILTNGVVLRAKGAGGQIRGFRPDCVILDDIETDESVVSEDQRKKLKDWLFRACLNTLLPGGQLVIVGTILHPLSVLADLLDTPNGWCKRKYRAYIDAVQEEGQELWASARPHAWLQKRKSEIGSFAFASEFLNDPKMDDSIPIKPEYLRYWETLPGQFNGVIAVDPAYSDEEKSDWKVASHIVIDPLSNRYLVRYIRTHAPLGEFIDSFLNMYEQNRGTITAIGLPNSGVEKSFYLAVLKRAEERKIYAPFIELKNVIISTTGSGNIRNKKKRITASLQPLFENGKYYIHANHHEAREEILTIGSSRWDDIVDTMSYAEQILTPMHSDEGMDEERGRYGQQTESEKQTIRDSYGY